MTSSMLSLAEHFGDLEDPRVKHLVNHQLLGINIMAICAFICGADGWTDVALFGQEREGRWPVCYW